MYAAVAGRGVGKRVPWRNWYENNFGRTETAMRHCANIAAGEKLAAQPSMAGQIRVMTYDLMSRLNHYHWPRVLRPTPLTVTSTIAWTIGLLLAVSGCSNSDDRGTASVPSASQTATASNATPSSSTSPNGGTQGSTLGSTAPSNGSTSGNGTTSNGTPTASTSLVSTDATDGVSQLSSDTAGEPGSTPAPGGVSEEPVSTSDEPGSEPPLLNDRSEVGTCQRWNADHENMDEGTWSGSVTNCEAGDISADGRANALRLYNLYRWLADLPPVETSEERNRLAQACSLLMEANNKLSHEPAMDWKCWTQDGADGAGSSNITTGASVASVSGYMLDPGNDTTLGHRRWILSNSLGPIGIGSTGGGASCMQNLGGEGDAGKAYMTWPPAGVFPLQAYSGSFGVTLNETGWSIQSDAIELDNAVVTVTSEGAALPTTVTQLLGGYGSRYALRFNPDGWEPEAGKTYSVNITGIDEAITYDVKFVDCG